MENVIESVIESGLWVKEIEAYLISKGVDKDTSYALSVWLEKKSIEASNNRYKELVFAFANGITDIAETLRSAFNE